MTTGPYSQGNVGMSAGPPPERPPAGLPPEGVGTPVEEHYEHYEHEERPESLSAELAERLWWVLPVLLIALGFLLGWADQSATVLKNDLRFPAMIAALLLFGQGGAEILARIQKRAAEAEAAEAAEAELRAEEAAVAAQVAAQAPTTPAPARLLVRSAVTPSTPSGANMLAILLMVLGVWLGLETLYVTQQLPVVTLSLLASFLLFTFGWKLLTKGP